jgi:hypothetical protein
MLVLNAIFKTAFFWLSLYGAHSIYNVVICKSSILSAILYFMGLMFVLLFGYFYQKFLEEIIYNKSKKCCI